jgi:hypothetical protein
VTAETSTTEAHDVRGVNQIAHRLMEENEELRGLVGASAERMRAQLLLIRVILGLNPGHDVVECVRILHDEGFAVFEKVRGERCTWASQWRPS